jgi:hypothetical protein
METKLYTCKGHRRDNRGSIALVNQALAQYKEEVGLAPTEATLSAQRRETLPDEIAERTWTLQDGTAITYRFSDELALNQVQCSGITPRRVQLTLKQEASAFSTFSSRLRQAYPGAQVKYLDPRTGSLIVTLNQESWTEEEACFFAFLQHQAFVITGWQPLTCEVTP